MRDWVCVRICWSVRIFPERRGAKARLLLGFYVDTAQTTFLEAEGDPSTRPLIHPSVCPPIHPSIYPHTPASIRPPVHLSIHLPIPQKCIPSRCQALVGLGFEDAEVFPSPPGPAETPRHVRCVNEPSGEGVTGRTVERCAPSW